METKGYSAKLFANGDHEDPRLQLARVVVDLKRRQGGHEHGKDSKRAIAGVLARARKHVCRMQTEEYNRKSMGKVGTQGVGEGQRDRAGTRRESTASEQFLAS